MGRKMLTCNVGDTFGCYEVMSEPYLLGEHSFVHVKCLNCGNEQDIALSEIKNRPKKICKKCRGQLKRIYPDSKNWRNIL